MNDLSFLPFARYRSLVDDWDAFCDALARPLPTCIWTNTLRTTPRRLLEWLADDGLTPTPIPWYPGAYTLPDDAQPGARLPYAAGLYHIQEEVSLLPVVLLAPRPGERVLDLCAAPGGKTAQIAVALRNHGTVVANDRHAMRLGVVRATAERLGLLNVATTTYDAANYPGAAGVFDRVLADVPCSCEGTSRKHPGVLEQASPEASEAISGVQRAILRKAAQLCRPGGRIVYSTCTYAPEENEAVVDALLREDDRLRVVPAAVPGFAADPGLTEWRGARYDASLRHALRYWPHRHDTGGFFAAVLEKRDADHA